MILDERIIRIRAINEDLTDLEFSALCDAIETVYERLDLEGIVKSQFVDKDLSKIRITVTET
jgi:hypothetical protein